MQSPRAHGFTLIEIIVSVSLLLVLSGLFLASYNGFNSSQTVKQAAVTLVRNLQAVRAKAASGSKPAGCDTLTGYIVKFPDAGSYTAQAVCQSGEIPQITTYRLPTGVTFSPVPSSVTFYPLDRGASVSQTVVLTGYGVTANVWMTTAGLVSQ